MMADNSFDIVSEPDLQLVNNALNTARKEIAARYDFRGSAASIELNNLDLLFKAEDDYKIGAMLDMFKQKAIKQGVDLAFFDFGQKTEDALGGTVKQNVRIKKGIDREKAKEINQRIKDLKLKVNPQIQGEAVRVSGKNKDDLQKVIQALRGADLGLALTFTNYR
ncbi:MAG: YajQ family cyclic di-GMP-binding protein [Candidatus Margulisbacteria bacterium]|nr:YajQ family cyclic di-GMP-binding protein [Candidatus Margulisiibacteriota bacterium]